MSSKINQQQNFDSNYQSSSNNDYLNDYSDIYNPKPKSNNENKEEKAQPNEENIKKEPLDEKDNKKIKPPSNENQKESGWSIWPFKKSSGNPTEKKQAPKVAKLPADKAKTVS